ncbi:hypothetical protein AnigIFM62618_002344 [Aspergillus niger]|nr:hypothetical protein AnigIFM62618_002344 [Aspergillus niger]
MVQMKRSCSGSPLPSKRVPTTACLTIDALKEHDQNARPVSLITRLDIAPEQKALYTAIDELKPGGLEIARNRDWREDLKPPVYNPIATIPRKRDRSQQIVPGSTTTDNLYKSPSINPAEPTIPIFKVKDPRPDIGVGLSDENLANALVPKKDRSIARRFLVDLQETSSLISDPHVTPLGLRFPFLVVEAKAAATGGNLYQAQNQAAVGGSAALQIFKNLSDLQDMDEGQGTTEDSTVVAEDSPNAKLCLAFSVTTEGPIHELWLHLQKPREEDFLWCVWVPGERR